MAKFLMMPAQVSITLWTSDSYVSPIFPPFCTGVCIAIILSSFTIIHCVCDGGGGKILVIYLAGHWNTRETSEPSGADCVSCRGCGLWDTCSERVGLCCLPLRGSVSEYSACKRKDGTDIWWAKGQTVPETASFSSKSTLSLFHMNWTPGCLSKRCFSASLLIKCGYVTKFSTTEPKLRW